MLQSYTFSGSGDDETGDPLSILAGGDDLGALAQAVVISLLSRRLAEDGDPLPAPDRRCGWWADGLAADTSERFGSRLWLLERTVARVDTAATARQYAEESLAWLVTDGLAARFEVIAEVAGTMLALSVSVWRADGTGVSLRFADLWSSINA